jgi:hypothetical protein
MPELDYEYDDDTGLWIGTDEETGLRYAETEDGDVYGLALDGTLLDEDGGAWALDESNTPVPLDEDEVNAGVAEFALAQNQRALESKLGRPLTEAETFAMYDAASRTGELDAEKALERAYADGGGHIPDVNNDDDRIALMADYAHEAQAADEAQQQGGTAVPSPKPQNRAPSEGTAPRH